jgi:hypothetical protein
VGSKLAEKKCATALAEHGCVEIRGARQNNLKGLDVDLPLGKMTVVTGPSGSGKSSLAFETVYAEGQRRYVETFSPYMRQFLDRMDKPRVDDIRGIPPAIAIEQSNPVKTSRSTVGTMTEINDYLKLLWPRVAKAFCPNCGREIRSETAKSIADEVFRLFSAGPHLNPLPEGEADAKRRGGYIIFPTSRLHFHTGRTTQDAFYFCQRTHDGASNARTLHIRSSSRSLQFPSPARSSDR